MKKGLIVASLFALALMISPIALFSMEYEYCVNCNYGDESDGSCDDGSCDSEDTEDTDID